MYQSLICVTLVIHLCLTSAMAPYKSKCAGADPSREGQWIRRNAASGVRFKSLEEECLRRKAWEENVLSMDKFNRRKATNARCLNSNVGENGFEDWTKDEMSKLRGYKSAVGPRGAVKDPFARAPFATTPCAVGPSGAIIVDYVVPGFVSLVKNQGQCGSCWAFSATGAMESQLAMKRGIFVSLSEQQLVDCANETYGCSGCDGGIFDGAFLYAEENGGIVTNNHYRYTATDDRKCNIPADKKRFKCGDYIEIAHDEEAMLLALIVFGSISCAMDANISSFWFYTGGVYSDPLCARELNHAVLIVGVGTTADGIPYWLVKNSWGTKWGEYGYFRMLRGVNQCNIIGHCSVPVKCNIC